MVEIYYERLDYNLVFWANKVLEYVKTRKYPLKVNFEQSCYTFKYSRLETGTDGSGQLISYKH